MFIFPDWIIRNWCCSNTVPLNWSVLSWWRCVSFRELRYNNINSCIVSCTGFLTVVRKSWTINFECSRKNLCLLTPSLSKPWWHSCCVYIENNGGGRGNRSLSARTWTHYKQGMRAATDNYFQCINVFFISQLSGVKMWKISIMAKLSGLILN